MAKTITWKDIEDRTCILTINDGSVATTELTPGENPFVTQTDDMDDIFQPIRSTTGNIGIVIDSVDDVVSMIGRTPITTPVTLTVEEMCDGKDSCRASHSVRSGTEARWTSPCR